MRKINWKQVGVIFIVVLIIILIFTLIDAFIHSLSENWSVPDYYFRNKIIFGSLIGFITYLFAQKKRLFVKSLIFSAVISILLQIRYYLEGFPLKFVLEFLFFHFLILAVVSLIVFWLFRKKI